MAKKKDSALDPEVVAIGARIRQARIAKGMKQAALSQIISPGQNVTVYRHEKGTVRPLMVNIMKYAAALDVTSDWIMKGGPFGGPEGPAQIESKPLSRVKDADAGQVPMVVAQLLASGRLGPDVSVDEIAFLSRHARVEPGLTADDFEVDLLARRARNTRSEIDLAALNAALSRHVVEHRERTFELHATSDPPSSPDTVRKVQKRKPRKR